ncbi:hypothetical protein LGH82_07195 [Mesorhizobium sp. PAMC28654]|uniref:hypothetical protein n=1 Tax=Mesorhizobium sp. PAMC28654 TaxID=2880934 RepID=UPI001D09BDFE|nr:hypothetical protein [Mesorhizobium sp. PAMC28654]UDL91055.1 hypothetical protein LGH82_07195 [Mesorhizobium sp. PAMC28654]
MNANDLKSLAVSSFRMGTPDKKPDCTFMQSGIRQEWRGKTGHVPALKHTVRAPWKFRLARKIKMEKSAGHGSHANAALHNCHD